MQFAIPNRCCTHDEAAVVNSFFDRRKFRRLRKERSGAYSGNRLAKCLLKRRDQAQIESAEVTHHARRGANIQRIARADKHDAQILEVGWRAQSAFILRDVRNYRAAWPVLSLESCNLPESGSI